MEEEKKPLTEDEAESGEKNDGNSKVFACQLAMHLLMCFIYAAVDLGIGVWVTISLQSFSANMSIAMGNASVFAASSAPNATASVSLLQDSAYITTAIGAFAAAVFFVSLVSIPCCKEKLLESASQSFGAISGILSLAAGICAAVFLAHLNENPAIWAPWQAQNLTNWSIAIIVVSFGLGFGAAILVCCVVCCGAACLLASSK